MLNCVSIGCIHRHWQIIGGLIAFQILIGAISSTFSGGGGGYSV